jgi:serine phosphatase RsbU (regulator of sigma subunit)
MGNELQKQLLRTHIPATRRFDMAAASEMAARLGGDYYDFSELSESTLAVIVADASGNGSSALLRATQLKQIFRSLVTQPGNELKEIACRANEGVLQRYKKGMFVTAVIATLDVNTGEGAMVRCGHCYPLIWVSSQRRTKLVKASGVGLGIGRDIFNREIEVYPFRLDEGDVLLLYTDGLFEARAADNQEFGIDRVVAEFVELAPQPAAQIVQGLLAGVKRFAGEIQDDIAVVAIKGLAHGV